VDAFTDTAFKGNPAAVCILEEERDEEWLQAVAREFNFSETCYLTGASGSELPGSANGGSSPRFQLRWFTPVKEVSEFRNSMFPALLALIRQVQVIQSVWIIND